MHDANTLPARIALGYLFVVTPSIVMKISGRSVQEIHAEALRLCARHALN